ncbi:MAG: trehalose-phosphatase [Actinomycetia bacterium]|nr:trehalose-phosphatase [Actinomycetes bacterium]
MTELEDRLRQLARVPTLLVACDYDGTVAPIVDEPMHALPRRSNVIAMRALADLPQTHVSVISGRSLRDLAALSRLPEEIRLVGSHGSEFDVGFVHNLGPDLEKLRTEISVAVGAISSEIKGSYVEQKPTGVSFHHRMVSTDDAGVAIRRILDGPGAITGVHSRRGNEVVELSVVDTNKGHALDSIRRQVGASAVVYFGDDITDEDVFTTISGPDVGVKVGEGPTAASFRLADTEDVARILAQLVDLRTDWLQGAGVVPIEEHSLLSDQRVAAIVTPEARITWLCAPRIDSAAIFAELIGGQSAGYFSVAPTGEPHTPGQRYLGDTMILETSWDNLTVTDYLDVSGGRAELRAGRSDLVRRLDGTGLARIEFAPRLDFGRVPTRIEVRDEGVDVVGSTDLIVLRAPGVTWELVTDGNHQTAVGLADLDQGPITLELRMGTGTLRPAAQSEPVRRQAAESFWTGWVDRLRIPDVHPDLVRRSALAIKSLCHGPSGAIVAAATTSLPENLGGIRNWDYRYCWLRDAALSAASLVRLGSVEEAMAYLDWVLRVLDEREHPERLAPLFNVTGRHLPPEAEITELSGYAGSRPVRVGNAAEGQVQLDVFGPIVDLAHLLLEAGAPLSGEHLRLVQAMVGAVAKRWHEPDHGIWEIRKPPRHHVHSKAMCWLTVDRGISITENFLDHCPDEWLLLRDEIAADVLDQGWKPEVKSFTAAYDDVDMDASVLAVGLSGLLAADDERFVATVNAVESTLREGPTVYRYRADDGLPGVEGGFHLMTSWLIDAYLLVGRRDDAADLFDQYCGLVGSTGLMPEEYDPASGRSLGNHPQAYSHLGLINNALNLAD